MGFIKALASICAVSGLFWGLFCFISFLFDRIPHSLSTFLCIINGTEGKNGEYNAIEHFSILIEPKLE